MDKRPIFLNLSTIAAKMSITAKVSILHRISGVLMFLALPVVLYLLHKSLTNPSFFELLNNFSLSLVVKLGYIILIWALMHHIVAGVRFLLLDIHVGVARTCAQSSAKWVMVISIILTIVLGWLVC